MMNKYFSGWLVIFLTSLIIPLTASEVFSSEQDNYCHDPSSWVEWNELLQRNPTDDGIHSAYALRVGLCEMVEKEMIDFNRAVDIFEHFRDSLVTTKERLKEQQEKNEANENST